MDPNSTFNCSFGADSSPLIHPGSSAFYSRREFLVRNGVGFGGLSLAALFGLNPFDLNAADAPRGPLAPKQPHFKAKAKRVIQIFAGGAPSTVDTWDPKPDLVKNHEKKIPGYEGLALGSPFKFEKKGKSGVEVSEIFPEIGKHIDDIAVIRSLFAEIPDHSIAAKMLMTGSPQLNKPSLGSWSVYGLGTDNQNLPGFITLGGDSTFRQSAFLPGIYQGCNVNYDPNAPLTSVLANISSQFSTPDRQRHQIDLAKEMNKLHAEQLQKDAQLEARIEAFEIAFKMQKEAMDAFDISKEPEKIKEMYGIGGGGGMGMRGAAGNGAKLLVARRLVERGVRFVQVATGGWDTHSDIGNSVKNAATAIDGPAGALLADLKQRGLLDETLVIWGGEFGRTVTAGGGAGAPGRDHNGRAMCAWMAGGGVKGGTTYGATDEFGGRAVENKMHVHDLHATILALLGFDHTKLTYNYNGREFRLTDNFGNVVKEIIA
ncbi:MAG: hypothetical protein RLZZ244_2703 [Verrucomicrobiota bacterium]|jgi:hypothetical protein